MAPAPEKQPNGSSTVNVDPDDFEYPPGYRFHPYDEELVYHYLVDYVNRRESGDHTPVESRPTRKRRHIIPEVDIYKFGNPNIIKEKYPLGATSNKDEWYFFTPLSRKYPKGDRPSRTCGDNAGFWKPTGKDKDIKVGGVSAKRKCLEYLRGKPPGRKTDWKMHEYKLDDDQESGDKTKKLCPALCRIYLNTRKKDKNDDDQDVQGSDVAVADADDRKGAKEIGSETGSNKSPVEGELVAMENQVIYSSHENADADADEVVVVEDQNGYQNGYESYDYAFVDSCFDEGVMDAAGAWYDENVPPGSCSPFFAYFDDPTLPPQI